MARYDVVAVVGTAVSFLIANSTLAQAPPQPLPASITGVPPQAPITPTSGVATAPSTTPAPISRFQNLNAFPPETVQSLYSMRAGADWLWRMNQSNGRFFPGLNPAVRMPLDGDLDLRQAYAALALAEAARFTGDERYAARATQAALALLTLTQIDPSDASCRAPALSAEKATSVAFAALLCQTLCELPNPEPKLLAEAEALGVFLRKRVQANGSIAVSDEASPANSDAADISAGLALRALVMTYRLKPEPAKREAILRCVSFYSNQFASRKDPVLATAMIPAFTAYLANANDPNTVATTFAMADALCACQYTRTDARSAAWVGGFKLSGAEPGADSLTAASALAAAVKLTRQVPDLTRFARYRQATVEGLAFARSLQFSDENAEHFEKSFRTRFLNGAAHLSPSDGTVRIDVTGHLASAQLAFLQSGAETRTD